jgi:membrane protein implicated in regulation of membrane protease activity
MGNPQVFWGTLVVGALVSALINNVRDESTLIDWTVNAVVVLIWATSAYLLLRRAIRRRRERTGRARLGVGAGPMSTAGR